MRKLASILLALVLVFALSLPAFAAGQKGETYTAYKIFEASVGTAPEGEEAPVSYTISESSGWYSTVKAYADLPSNGLTLTASAADSDIYVVSVSDSFSASAFAAELAKSTSGKTVSGTATAGESTSTITVTDGDGYYLITSSLGSICQLVTGSTLTIVEKNTVPSITKEVRIDAEDWANSTTIDVIDTIDYQLTVNTGNNTTEGSTGTGVNSNYVITDKLPQGFAYVMDTTDATKVAVTVKFDQNTWTENTDYTVSTNDGNLVVTLLSTGALKDLGQNADIIIEYSATVTAANATIGTIGNPNTATLTYSKQTDTASATVYTYEIGGLDAENKPYFQKIDGSTQEALAGVTFVLSKTENGTTTYATVDDSGYLTGWSDTAINLVTDSNGSINVKGLDAGTYTLTETATVGGYNLLDDTITVIISEEGNVTYKLTSSNENPGPSITVRNNKGTALPSTGGTGTTVLYILGTILVLGAGVLLVVRRRMNAER